MKKLISMLVLSICLLMINCKKEAVKANSITDITIEGMSCPDDCAVNIQKKLSESKGVEKAIVDFDKKTAHVSYDNKLTNPQNLIVAIQSAGKYTASLSPPATSIDCPHGCTESDKTKCVQKPHCETKKECSNHCKP